MFLSETSSVLLKSAVLVYIIVCESKCKQILYISCYFRFDVPGISAMNFMLYNSLGGGGIASLRSDPQVQFFSQYNFMPGSRGVGQGGQDPLPRKNHKNIGFLSNTCPDPLKNHKADKPAFNFGPSLALQPMPFKWHFAGGPIMARL